MYISLLVQSIKINYSKDTLMKYVLLFDKFFVCMYTLKYNGSDTEKKP